MNIFIYPAATSNHIQLTWVQHVSIWDDAGQLLFDYENAGAPVTPPVTPPIDPPVTPPVTPPAGTYPTPVPPVIVPWPTSGQVVLHVQMRERQTVCYRLVWADSKMEQGKQGFVKVSEQPGAAVMGRRMKLNVNGILKYDGPWDNAPSCALVNYPTPGQPYQVSLNLGETLDIIIENGPNPTAQPSDILLDLAVPDRY